MNEEKVKIVVERYMRAWIAGNVHKMHKNCQVTWKSEHKEMVLRELYKGLNLQKFEVLGMECAGSCAYKVAVEMTINGETVVSCVMAISEFGPYRPTKDGTIGINPISVLQYKLHE